MRASGTKRISRRRLLSGLAGISAAGLVGCQAPGSSRPGAGGAHPEAGGGSFEDVAAAAGIRFAQGHGGRTPLNILETIGSGCAFLDYDADGWLDILLVGQPSCALYRNRRDGTFEDVTAKAELGQQGHWLGVAVGDFNNDGFPDLYISGYDCGALYRNRGDGTFEDITRSSGVQPRRWETGCGFLDATGDGTLDLYVARYVLFGPKSQQYCERQGIKTTCGPLVYPPDRGSLYLNRGGRFEEYTGPAGLGAQHGNGLGVSFADYKNLGRASIALANDTAPADLFENLGHGRFRNVAADAGIALDPEGEPYGGMGIDWGDYNNDGILDLVIGTYYNQPSELFRGYPNGLFINESSAAGVGEPMAPWVNFGLRFLDYDNDGFLDLIVANGHAQTNLEPLGVHSAYHQPLQLFHNTGRGRFMEVEEPTAGRPFHGRYVGRGLAVGDYDGDGRLDVLIVDSEGPAKLLRNMTGSTGHWLQIDLEGRSGPRSGEGAVIRLQAGGQSLMRNVTTSGSHLSANPSRVHFGLGAAPEATRVTIEWPNGPRQTIPSLAADRVWRIREGSIPG